VGEVALRALEAALETEKGTAKIATRILAARITGTSFNRNREWVDEDRGSFVQNYRQTEGGKDYSFTLEVEAASYEQLPWFFETAVKGSVTATGGGITFTPSSTGVTGDDLNSATIDFGDDTQMYQMTYCEANSFTLGFDTLAVGGAFPLKFSADYRTKSLTSNSQPSNALSYPTLTTIEATSATFYLGAIATAFASLPVVSGSLRSFSLSYDNAMSPKLFVGDGKEYSALGRGKRSVTFEGTFEGNAAGVTRFAEWDLNTSVRMRLKFVDGSKSFTIDGRIKFDTFDPVGSVETNTVYALNGSFEYDSDLDSDICFAFAGGQTTPT
jgi:hypothetical protein